MSSEKIEYAGILIIDDVKNGATCHVYGLLGSSVGDTFPRLISSDESCVHPTFKAFIGKRVRITVEVVE
jgi:hypothetical protein